MTTPVTVVGPGRVGSVFVRCARAAGREVTIVGREGPIAATGGPRIVCTRADDLDDVIGRAEAPDDLVFVQNGLLEPVLARHRLAGATQGVIWFAATARDGRARPGAPSLFFGPRAAEVVAILRAGGVDAAEAPDAPTFAREAAVKVAWLAIFGVLGERWGETVGASVERPEVATLCDELAPVLSKLVGQRIAADGLRARLVGYSRAIPDFRASVKELAWRNGLLVRAARAQKQATPVHLALLRALGRPDLRAWMA